MFHNKSFLFIQWCAEIPFSRICQDGYHGFSLSQLLRQGKCSSHIGAAGNTAEKAFFLCQFSGCLSFFSEPRVSLL